MDVGDPVVFDEDEPELGLERGTPGRLIAIRTAQDVDFQAADGRQFTTELSSLTPARKHLPESAN